MPAQELLGDLLIELDKPSKALEAYNLNLSIRPNRFNSIYGAAIASKLSGNQEKATIYFEQLLKLVEDSNSDRPEIVEAIKFLKLKAI